ncbi:MAG TPA: hypothetical protein VHX13_03865 [Acidobacteriaceae bacterium]|jgi:hypothetical protein|nr:hypothetical protein [Acidobacteriaceae bacterium]
MDEQAHTADKQPLEITSSVFQLKYEGPAVDDGTMDVRDLAPSLEALGDLISRSNDLLNGENSTVTLKVLAKFDKASFDVSFLLNHVLADSAATMLPVVGSCSAAQILDLALGAYEKAKGVLSGAARIYKAVRGEKPLGARPGEQANTTVLVFGNNNNIVADSGSARLYGDDRIRAALRKTATPLIRGGVNGLEVRRSKQLVERLEPRDIGEAPDLELTTNSEEEPRSPTRDLWVRVVKPNFDGGRWTFHDGQRNLAQRLRTKAFKPG